MVLFTSICVRVGGRYLLLLGSFCIGRAVSRLLAPFLANRERLFDFLRPRFFLHKLARPECTHLIIHQTLYLVYLTGRRESVLSPCACSLVRAGRKAFQPIKLDPWTCGR